MTNNTASEKKIDMKEGWVKLTYLRMIFLVVNVLAVIPLFVISFYNVPAADDFSMAFEVHEAYVQSGSIFGAVLKAIYMGIWYYLNWTGYFFSDALTALAPSVFGEKYYFLGTFVVIGMLTLGLWFFMKQLLTNILGVERNLTGCITSVTYFLLIQCMPEGSARCESFFWYSGAINYMFMFGLALLWLGFLLKETTLQKEKGNIPVLISFLGFLLGGANYMTALSLAVISLCILFVTGYSALFERIGDAEKEKWEKIPLTEVCRNLSSVNKVAWPAVFNLMGFMVSVIGPGNSNRATASPFGPFKAIFVSIYYTLEYMLGEWITWPVICLLVLLIPLMWKAVGKIGKRYRFQHPVLFSLFGFLLSAANITPPLYATGNIVAGRIMGIFYTQTMLLLVLILGYSCGWARTGIEHYSKEKGLDEKKLSPLDIFYEGYFGKTASKTIIYVSALFVIGSLLAVKVNSGFYTSTAAVSDIVNGSAGRYEQEFNDRLSLLHDENLKDVSLEPYSVRPSLLFFSDITADANDWLNKAVAEYYHKDSVILK